MSHSPTQAERRSNIDYELFELTDEIKAAMEQSKLNSSYNSGNVSKPKNTDEKNNFRAYNQDQSFFITVTREKFLEASHPAAIIDIIIERLDMTAIYNYYSDKGNPPYHPKMMLKILFYSYYSNIMSSRTIWDAVVNRSDFMFLASGQVPDFRTINRFRLRHLRDMPDMFTQIILMCKELGMIGFDTMAIDGEKIQANASYRNSKNLKGLKKEYARLKNGLEKLLKKEAKEAETNTSNVNKKRIEKLNRKMNKLEDFQKKLEELNDEDKRINMVDPDAKVMAHKDGQKLPSYSHQTVVDEKYGVVTAVQTTQNNDLPEDLLELVDKSKENTGEEHKSVLADCGFCSYENLVKMEDDRTEKYYVPDRRFASSKKSEKHEEEKKYSIERFTKNKDGYYNCPANQPMKFQRLEKYKDGHTTSLYQGTACSGCHLKERCTKQEKRSISIDSRIPYRDIMRDRLKSDEGREIYMKRQGLIEPVHGDDQKNKGWIQHHLRSLGKAKAEFFLMRISTNLSLMIKHRDEMILAWD